MKSGGLKFVPLYKAGDENSKFFHQFAKGRKAINTIWELENDDGTSATTFEQLAQKDITHFKDLYKAPQQSSLTEIIKVATLFPRYVDQNSTKDLLALVTFGELEYVLKWFKKDNSPDPDGWSVEFYLDFFYFPGQDL